MGQALQPIDMMTPGQNLESYVQGVSTIPILSADEEHDLAERLYYEGDLEAARSLVMSHLRFVVHIAKSYSGYGLNQGDLIQEGNVGLMKAVKRFNPEVGVRLVSFAVHWIKAEIHEFILKNWRIVKVATTKAQRKMFFNLRSAKKTLTWLSNSEVESVASDLGVTPAVVRQMEGRMSSSDMAFDAGSDDDDDSAYQAPANYLEDASYDPATMLENGNWEADSNRRLESAMLELDDEGKSVMLAAGDTFRAAAVEQLQVWGERNSVPVVAQHTGSDSASVIYDAIESAKSRGIDIVIADTAGRLQNKANLMTELEKVVRVMKKLDPEAPHEVMLVLDAGTGQNALSQAKLFTEAVGVSGITLTKLDGTAKGGIIFAIAKQFGLPIRYIGVGEQADDLRPFKSQEFVDALFANE